MAQRAPGATHASWSDSNGDNWSRGITNDGSSIAHITVPLLFWVFSSHSASTSFLPTCKIVKLSDVRQKHMNRSFITAIYHSEQNNVLLSFMLILVVHLGIDRLAKV